jgi:selenocysteine lyase/cysteine desulfurase
VSSVDRIAFFQGKRDEVPNQALARELVENFIATRNEHFTSSPYQENYKTTRLIHAA